MKHVLIFIFLALFPLLSLAQNITCPSLFDQTQKDPTHFSPGDVVIDSQRGFIKVIDVDYENDRLTGRAMDGYHTAQHFGTNAFGAITNTRSYKYSYVPFIINFKNRTIYRVPTEASGALVRNRIQATFGLSTIRAYFALFRFMELIDTRDSKFYYKENFRSRLSQKSGKAVYDVLDDWTKDIFSRKQNDLLDFFLNDLQNLTGQDLAKAGILSSSKLNASLNAERFLWPRDRISPTKKNVTVQSMNAATVIEHLSSIYGKSTRVNQSVPQDIDHYSRSWIWESSSDIVNFETLSMAEFTSVKPSDSIIIEPNAVELAEALSDDNIFETNWRDIYNVAISTAQMPEVYGKDVIIALPGTVDNIGLIGENFRSQAWYNGAKSVKVVAIKE